MPDTKLAVWARSAKDAKFSSDELIVLARTHPITVAVYGRPVVVVMSVEKHVRPIGEELEYLIVPNPVNIKGR